MVTLFQKSIKIRIKNACNLLRTKAKKDKTKVFCIGRNKTGTTSMKVMMEKLGFVVGDQRTAELLLDDWAEHRYEDLIKYCKTAQFFQDVPFSLPETYVILDKAFPGSKFILTIRDNAEQWYNSVTRFHAKLWGKNGRIPTKEDLQSATYIVKGRPWINNQLIYNTPESDPYNKEVFIKHYNKHNEEVKLYFKNRPNDLLVLNVAEKGAVKKLTQFLGFSSIMNEFPWVNKT